MHTARLVCTCLLTFAFLALGNNPVHAQQKFEREIRIRPQAVPAAAEAFVSACIDKGKVRWYKEINLGFYSFEAKATRNGHHYSIEFDSLGVIQDVEMVIRFDHLTNVVQSAITAELTGRCSKYRITRVQRQWTGSTRALQAVIREGSTAEQYTERIEIVFSCKTDKAPVLYEALFDAHGKLENLLEIIPRNTDNLDF